MNASQGRGGQVGHDVPSFADDQAAKTGQSARSIRRDADRGQQVCKEALDILKCTAPDFWGEYIRRNSTDRGKFRDENQSFVPVIPRPLCSPDIRNRAYP